MRGQVMVQGSTQLPLGGDRSEVQRLMTLLTRSDLKMLRQRNNPKSRAMRKAPPTMQSCKIFSVSMLLS
jgi:hypothetical protein